MLDTDVITVQVRDVALVVFSTTKTWGEIKNGYTLTGITPPLSTKGFQNYVYNVAYSSQNAFTAQASVTFIDNNPKSLGTINARVRTRSGDNITSINVVSATGSNRMDDNDTIEINITGSPSRPADQSFTTKWLNIRNGHILTLNPPLNGLNSVTVQFDPAAYLLHYIWKNPTDSSRFITTSGILQDAIQPPSAGGGSPAGTIAFPLQTRYSDSEFTLNVQSVNQSTGIVTFNTMTSTRFGAGGFTSGTVSFNFNRQTGELTYSAGADTVLLNSSVLFAFELAGTPSQLFFDGARFRFRAVVLGNANRSTPLYPVSGVGPA